MFSDLKIMQLHFCIDKTTFEAPVSIFAMPCILINDDVILAHI